MNTLSDPFFDLFPVLFGIFFIAVFLYILVIWGKKAVQWHSNNQQPIITEEVEVVAKRSEVSGHEHTYTSYYCTFEMANGAREEFSVSGKEYGRLAEGDVGTLTFQGTRYHGFDRKKRVEFTA